MENKVIDWYFDFISPFAYLQCRQLNQFKAHGEVVYRPVLLAGLLSHWGQKGPAEIPTKRSFTYSFVQWYAEKHGIPFRCPPAHPFNPLRALRLALAAGNNAEAVQAIFEFIWMKGGDISDDRAFLELGQQLGFSDALKVVADKDIKAELVSCTQAAIARQVFGVPTLTIDDQLFFGNDASQMAMDYLANPQLFATPEMQRLRQLPQTASRL